MARHKRGLTPWRGGRERSRLVSLETWHVTNDLKRGLANWRGRGRSGLESWETWHVTNEDSQTGGGGRGEESGRGETSEREKNKNKQTGGREGGGEGER